MTELNQNFYFFGCGRAEAANFACLSRGRPGRCVNLTHPPPCLAGRRQNHRQGIAKACWNGMESKPVEANRSLSNLPLFTAKPSKRANRKSVNETGLGAASLSNAEKHCVPASLPVVCPWKTTILLYVTTSKPARSQHLGRQTQCHEKI